ncbi:hypothetical protein AVEN_268412-1 [Araneus ventricosus]|uniref:Uncharacterized protein n=1 Tax=Araneus ventricosus TaxID=182803 RepID=A0A4Y2DWA6_ARAVE|nr:hypothetical protein AVEN_268412-1 [Araneus ventricosus]
MRCGNLESGVPAQVPPSSSDYGSKLRGSSQNDSRVAAKRDLNIPKRNLTVDLYQILNETRQREVFLSIPQSACGEGNSKLEEQGRMTK